MRLTLPLILIVILTANVVANGVGNEVKKRVDDLVFEFGIDPKEPKANELVTISLFVHNESSKEFIGINDLWIRISKGDKILFSSLDFRIKKENPLFMNYIFPENGNYTIDISARHNDKDIKTHFTIDVKDNALDIFKNILIFIIIFIVGYVLGMVFYKKKKML